MVLIILYCIFTMLFAVGRMLNTPSPEGNTRFQNILGGAMAIIIAPIAVPIIIGRDTL